ncbi:MAG TPA: hypothetical protein PK691_04525 [Thermomicrobiales bacterium]|nr:hypothetical protein [Thermomicrobiales bacterium]
MPAEEYQRWQRYETTEPFGDLRADLRIAALMAHLTRIAPNVRKSARRYDAWDYLPLAPEPTIVSTTPATPEATAAWFETVAAGVNHEHTLPPAG